MRLNEWIRETRNNRIILTEHTSVTNDIKSSITTEHKYSFAWPITEFLEKAKRSEYHCSVD